MCERLLRATDFGRALGHNGPPVLAAFRTEIDHPIRFGDELQVVLDDDHGVAGIHQALQHLNESLHVRHVQPDGGFLEDEQVALRARRSKQVGFSQAGEQVGDEL